MSASLETSAESWSNINKSRVSKIPAEISIMRLKLLMERSMKNRYFAQELADAMRYDPTVGPFMKRLKKKLNLREWEKWKKMLTILRRHEIMCRYIVDIPKVYALIRNSFQGDKTAAILSKCNELRNMVKVAKRNPVLFKALFTSEKTLKKHKKYSDKHKSPMSPWFTNFQWKIFLTNLVNEQVFKEPFNTYIKVMLLQTRQQLQVMKLHKEYVNSMKNVKPRACDLLARLYNGYFESGSNENFVDFLTKSLVNVNNKKLLDDLDQQIEIRKRRLAALKEKELGYKKILDLQATKGGLYFNHFQTKDSEKQLEDKSSVILPEIKDEVQKNGLDDKENIIKSRITKKISATSGDALKSFSTKLHEVLPNHIKCQNREETVVTDVASSKQPAYSFENRCKEKLTDISHSSSDKSE